MAVTKILARKGRLDAAVAYVLNGDKTEDRILTDAFNCDPGREARQMIETKRELGKEDGVQYYHMIQSFAPGEVTPELALEIAREFARRHLSDYEVVIGTHVDRQHIHSHILWNSVSVMTGAKYHSNAKSYYQVRALSDELCREHGLSVLPASRNKAVSYAEWLRQSRGQPTFRALLEADLRESIEDANDLGHFFLLMEHKGWEIKHGARLAYRLRGQERYIVPERKDPLFTEDAIRDAINGNLAAIEALQRPILVERPRYRPYPKNRKYSGFLALYVHYLYVLGKIEKRVYPPRMTPRLRASLMRFERYREQFAFLRENGITTQGELDAFSAKTEERVVALTKQRTILNVRKKKRQALYAALADAEALAPARECCESGLSGLEDEYARYTEAVETLEVCGIPRERLAAEKAALYEELAEVNRTIRAERKKLKLCAEIAEEAPRIERKLERIEDEKPKQAERKKEQGLF